MGPAGVYHPQGAEIMPGGIVSLQQINKHGGRSRKIGGLVQGHMVQHFCSFEPIGYDQSGTCE